MGDLARVMVFVAAAVVVFGLGLALGHVVGPVGAADAPVTTVVTTPSTGSAGSTTPGSLVHSSAHGHG